MVRLGNDRDDRVLDRDVERDQGRSSRSRSEERDDRVRAEDLEQRQPSAAAADLGGSQSSRGRTTSAVLEEDVATDLQQLQQELAQLRRRVGDGDGRRTTRSPVRTSPAQDDDGAVSRSGGPGRLRSSDFRDIGGVRDVPRPALNRRVTSPDITGAAHYMETDVTVNQDGMLWASTRTWSDNWIVGFTGGVIAWVTDEGGNFLHRTSPQTYGVDGKGIFWKPSSRMEFWQEQVPADYVPAARAIEILHFHAPRPRVGEIIKEILDTADDAAGAYAVLSGYGVF
ncbi:hypothetical protein SAMN05428965_3107 [Geodermatophilus sp. DSM 45219]|nr:hypothetical protein SAMN05428965_3107 [Geodermatophilus sp. DSM 45219]